MLTAKYLKRLAFCRHPRYVFNGFEYVLVRCGKCSSCLSAKSSRFSMLCEYEEASSKYCAFVTLKYSNKFVPKARFATEYLNVSFNPSIDENDICSAYCPIVSLCERDVDNYGEFISEQSFDVTKPIVPQILDAYKRTTPRSKYGNHPFLKGASCIIADDGLPAFGYACKRDYQLFLKKLRAKIKYYCNEEVRFFLASEYGPKTYRPHFHVLIWFNSKKTLSRLQTYCRESWLYGAIDYSLSRHQCGSYVAKYVNSYSSLPNRYRVANSPLTPYSRHSNYLGSSFFQSRLSLLQDNSLSPFTPFYAEVFGKMRYVSPTLQNYSSALPRLPFISRHDDRGVLQLFVSASQLLREKPQDISITEYCRILYNSDMPISLRYHLEYFLSYCDVRPAICDTSTYLPYTTHINRMSSVLLVIDKVLSFSLWLSTSVLGKAREYLAYLSSSAHQSLTNMYLGMISEDFSDCMDLLPFVYVQSLNVDSYNHNQHIQSSLNLQSIDFINSEKHKAQNDLYNLLISK